MRNATIRLAIGALALLVTAPAAWSAEVHLNRVAEGQMLTGPQTGDAADIALAYVNAHLGALQLDAADVADLELRDRYTSPNGVTHLYWRQRLDGIGVHNGDLGVNVAADGSIINVHHRMIPSLAAKAPAGGPALQPNTAVLRAAEHLGLGHRLTAIDALQAADGPAQRIVFTEAGISHDPIPAELRYQERADGTVALTWNVIINSLASSDWMEVRVDAASGEIVAENNWTAHGGPEYRVYPLPAESPTDSPQTLLPDPSNALASPFGWHDDNGAAGPEYTDTRGNNVWAQDDLDGNNSGGVRPDGGVALSFDFAHDDVNDGPTDGTNLEASIVNLFYYNNIMHDITYQYGFNEAAGNFQQNNYGNAPSGAGDPVNADALDGSGTDNANFATPPDGSRPRMQMFRWTAPPALEVNSPGSIAGTYAAGGAGFGAALDATGITGDLRLTDDGSTGDGTGSTTDACEALPANSMDGVIAVIDRGSCEFGLKVLNAENAGAIAAIVVNNQGDGTLTMGAGVNGGSVTIPSVFIGQTDGTTIKAELPGVNATMSKVGVDRDSDFDNGVIAHEYGHGISNRLTGGPTNVGCLPTTIPGGESEQAGEGWSDFWALVLSAVPTDTATTPRGIGTYVNFEAEDGPGIRNARYSTDESTNPIHDYANVGTINAPHGVGEIWMSAVWELYWELVTRYGFDPDFYNGTGGNNLTIQLVIDGMTLQPCQPTFVDARDAILLADMTNNGGANQCAIWRSFAKRGVGMAADAGTFTRGDETPDYTVPAGCEAGLFADGFESGDTTAWSSTTP